MKEYKKKSSIKSIILSFISLFMLIGLTFGCFFSIGYSTLNDDGNYQTNYNNKHFEIYDDGDATWTLTSEKSLEGKVTGKGLTSIGGKSKTGTFYFKYTGNAVATISFKYTLTLNNGSCEIDNSSINKASGTFLKENIQSSQTIPIKIVSGNRSKYTTTITITDIEITEHVSVTFTLLVPENGNYSFVNNKHNISSVDFDYEQTINTSGDIKFTLTAFPDENYEFFGWYFNNELVSYSSTYETTCSVDSIIYPKFVSNETALFKNNGVLFDNLNDAIVNAQQSTDKIVILNRSGALFPYVDYTIPSGITLYIPNDSSVNIYTNNDVVQEVSSTVKEYMSLTLRGNTSITAENGSVIYVAGICSGTNTGRIAGGYGHIILEDESSTINMQNGTNLYCYGFITGAGIVYAQYGSNVYEFFQMTSWRGGSATSDMLNNSQKVFVITQYYVQNIESRLKVYFGANIKVRTGITATFIGTVLAQADCTFIGDDGIFRLSSGYLERFYDATTDRIVYTVNGKTSISSISLDLSVSIFNYNINSANYVLPITNNMEINVINNSEITIDQDLCLLPGVRLIIDQGSILRFSQNISLFVYDNDNRYNQKFGGNGFDIAQLSYVGSNNNGKPGQPASRSSTANSPDAEIDLNGEIIVNDGASIYTTLGNLENGIYTGGANIHSSKKTGKITFVQGLGSNTKTYQVRQNNKTISYVDIDVDTAYLKNGDGSYFIPSQYTGGVENKTIYYDALIDRWTVTETQVEKHNITFKDSKSSSTFTMEYTVGESFTFPTKDQVNFSYKTYDIKYWQVGNYSYVPGQSIIMGNNGDMEAVAIWGGWIQNNGEYKYIDYDTGDYLTGLHKLESYNDTETNLYIYLFDDSGVYMSSYKGIYFNPVDDKTYYIINGKVNEKKGITKFYNDLSFENFEYIYIQNDNSLLTSIDNYYIDTNLNNLLPSGYYSFDSNGYIKRDDLDTNNYNGQIYIKDYVTYINGIKVSYGLFVYDSHYYYSNINCEIVRDTTFYVSKTNNLGISEGLYYFDGQGRMYDQNFDLIEVN